MDGLNVWFYMEYLMMFTSAHVQIYFSNSSRNVSTPDVWKPLGTGHKLRKTARKDAVRPYVTVEICNNHDISQMKETETDLKQCQVRKSVIGPDARKDVSRWIMKCQRQMKRHGRNVAWTSSIIMALQSRNYKQYVNTEFEGHQGFCASASNIIRMDVMAVPLPPPLFSCAWLGAQWARGYPCHYQKKLQVWN